MRSFSQLSYHERKKIYTGLCEGKTAADIGKMIGRPKSTITREVTRNSDCSGYYLYPGNAHEVAQARRNKNKPKIDKNNELKKYIVQHLRIKWSPKSIAGGWNSKANKQSITKESIYQWIYREKYYYDDDGSEIDLKKCLIRARRKRGMKRNIPKSKIKERVSVHMRPDHINQRIEIGHYECDLIFNKGSQSMNILTLIERVTRHATLIRNDDKRSETVIDALIKHIQKTGIIIKSITFDNGSEFAEHTKLKALGIATYFCDPGSPWQKGAIEHLNGMLRRYLPFHMLAVEISKSFVETVNVAINNIPREILGFKTPLQALNPNYMNKRVVIC